MQSPLLSSIELLPTASKMGLPQPTPPPSSRVNSGSCSPPQVSVDQEMTNLADNTIRNRALLAAIGKQMSIVRTAIEGGNR